MQQNRNHHHWGQHGKTKKHLKNTLMLDWLEKDESPAASEAATPHCLGLAQDKQAFACCGVKVCHCMGADSRTHLPVGRPSLKVCQEVPNSMRHLNRSGIQRQGGILQKKKSRVVSHRKWSRVVSHLFQSCPDWGKLNLALS